MDPNLPTASLPSLTPAHRSGPRLFLLFSSGWALAPLVQFVEHYLWSDWEFAATLAVLISVDTLTGLARAWRTNALSSKGWNGIIVKLLAYGATLVTLHTISHHTVQGQPNSALAAIVPYFDAVAYAAILVREALSIHENLAALGYPLLPAFLQRRFADFLFKEQEAAGSEQ